MRLIMFLEKKTTPKNLRDEFINALNKYDYLDKNYDIQESELRKKVKTELNL